MTHNADAVNFALSQNFKKDIVMKSQFFTALLTFVLLSPSGIGGETVKETTVKVFGNCGECKTRIEQTMKIPEIKYSKWDKKSKMLKVAYLSESISLDSLHMRIAAVGHDTERFTAADSVYDALPGCCLYRGGDFTH